MIQFNIRISKIFISKLIKHLFTLTGSFKKIFQLSQNRCKEVEKQNLNGYKPWGIFC